MTNRRALRSSRWNYLFLAPYLSLFLVFLILPLVFGLIISFQDYELIRQVNQPSKFVGLANYSEAMHDDAFWLAMWTTVKFVIFSVPLTICTALLFAVGIEAVPGKRQEVYRFAAFLPTMITISVAGILWRWFYNSEFGVFNALLAPFGLKAPWLLTRNWAMASIILMTLWWTIGAPTVILIAGLKQIPEVYYEAASIDGALGWRKFFYITRPLLRPVLLFITVITVIGAFQIFGQPFIITSGGPERSTRVIVEYIYETAFNFYRMGYGAAMSWLLFIVIVVFSFIQFRVMRER
jgi:multiple sugar transport system permease protein